MEQNPPPPWTQQNSSIETAAAFAIETRDTQLLMLEHQEHKTIKYIFHDNADSLCNFSHIISY